MTDAARPRRMMLAEAAALYGMKPGSLRREAAKGNLTTSLVAGKLWTTEADMEAMFDRCRRAAKAPISTSSEAATGPDREVDWCISLALGVVRPAPGATLAEIDAIADSVAYTASLDVIVGAIDEHLHGRAWQVDNMGSGWIYRHDDLHEVDEAATPALALCAAFARAMAERSEL